MPEKLPILQMTISQLTMRQFHNKRKPLTLRNSSFSERLLLQHCFITLTFKLIAQYSYNRRNIIQFCFILILYFYFFHFGQAALCSQQQCSEPVFINVFYFYVSFVVKVCTCWCLIKLKFTIEQSLLKTSSIMPLKHNQATRDLSN